MTQNHIPVSVIIPCYRCADTIERTIDSVAAQTFPPQEVICVEDYSDDDEKTLNKLTELQDKYGGEWLKIIRHETNRKAGYSRNSGWDNAAGKYVAFLDGDDTWHPRKLEIQYEIMEKSPDIDLSGNPPFILNNPEPFPTLNLPGKIRRVDRMEILMHNPFFTSSIMCKKSISLRFESRANCQDYQLWLDMFFHSCSMILIALPLTYAHKPSYGIKGLGSNIWRTYRALNEIFKTEHRKKNITLVEYIFIKIYWNLKQLRKIIMSYYYYLSFSHQTKSGL